MRNFPLNPFLESIKDDIPVCVRDCERMILVLQGGDVWTIQRLRDVLLALLVKNRDQQSKFLRRFDAFFPHDAQTVLNDLEIKRVIDNIKILLETPKSSKPQDIPPGKDKIVPKTKTKTVSRFKWWIPVSIGLTICAAFGLIWHFQPKPSPAPETSSPVITFEPDVISFDTLKKKGESATQAITLKNQGPGAAKLKNIEITGPHAEHFQHKTKAIPEELSENQHHDLSVKYSPGADGIHTAFLDVECNAKDSPVRAILKGKAETEEAPDQTAKRLYRNMPYVEKAEYYPLPEKSKDWIYYGCLALFFLLCAVYYGNHLHRSRKIPEDQPATFNPNAPRHFSLASVVGKRSAMLSEDLLDHLADCMGHFKSEHTGKNVDVDESVKATVEKSGIPEIVFSKRKQVRALLAMEDNFAESSAWNTIVGELVNGMQRRGVPVIHGRYDRSPHQFKTEDGRVYHLEDLEDQRRGFLVLIFGESRGIASQNLIFAMEQLARWPMKAWMDYKQECFQNDFTKQLQTLGIPVFPVSSDGVYQAVRQFLTEQGTGMDLPKSEMPRTSAEIPERPDALVEYLLGDALTWAQDCAMMQPIPLGLADAIRKQFHPHLTAERMSRLFSLPDTVNTPSGLRFPTNVQAVLRTGFKERRENQEQEAVLRFILDEIQKVKPAIQDENAEPGLDYLKWEAMVERLRMELDEHNDLERFAALAKSPLGPAMVGDLESYDFDDKDGKIPLRLKPENPKALQRLADLAGNPFSIPKLKAFPLKLSQWVALGIMVVCCFGFSGKGLYDYVEWQKPKNFEIAGSDLKGRLDGKTVDGWDILESWEGKPLTNRLSENAEYKLVLFENGYRTLNDFKTGVNQGTRVVIGREAKSCDCKEEFSEIGLTVLRCNPNKTGEKPLERKTWKEILGDKVPKDRLMSIGLEFADATDEQNQSLATLRDTLLETGSVDILYRVRPDENGKWNFEQIARIIQADIAPWIPKSQLIWWSNHIAAFSIMGISNFERTVKIDVAGDAKWRAALAKVFEPGYDIVVAENELFASLGKSEAAGNGVPVALVRAKKIYKLRKNSISVSVDNMVKAFKLDKNRRPLTYVANDYVDNGNGTITDNATGLMWQKSGSGQLTYKKAEAYVKKLNNDKFAGYSDWRLPTVDEMLSLVEKKEQSNKLYINPIFDSRQLWCWSADRIASNESSSGGACIVHFYYGDVNWYLFGSHYYARAVRSRQY